MITKKAFTLIELLVVIAIISLLVSILLPSLQQAKNLAKEVICKSNVKGVLTAMQLYSEDYNGWLHKDYIRVNPYAGGPTTNMWLNYQHMLHSYGGNETTVEDSTTMVDVYGPDFWRAPRSYVDNVEMFYCPMDDHMSNGWPQTNIRTKSSYGRNGRMGYSEVGGDPSGSSGGDYFNLQLTIRADRMYLLGETWHWYAFRVTVNDASAYDPESGSPLNYFSTRHGSEYEKGHIAFADGHVGYETLDTIGLYGAPYTTWAADLPWLNGQNPPWWVAVPPMKTNRWP